MLLKDVLIRRGIGFLEPNCVVMKGYQTSDHDEFREVNFARSLRLRLGWVIVPAKTIVLPYNKTFPDL
jgi:RecQ-mediated genome instability protein 1